MKLRYTRTSLRQIEEAHEHIETQSLQGAKGLRERILAVIALLQAHPSIGQTTRRRGTRRIVLTPFPYVIFYRLTMSEIVILRFRHAARRPPRH